LGPGQRRYSVVPWAGLAAMGRMTLMLQMRMPALTISRARIPRVAGANNGKRKINGKACGIQ